MDLGPVQSDGKESGSLAPWPVGPDDGCRGLEDWGFLDPWILEKPVDPLEAMHVPSWPMGPVTYDH